MTFYDNSKYAISYYDYGVSLLNKHHNEFFQDGKLTLDANYTLEEIIDMLLEEKPNRKGDPSGYNYLGLPIDLVSWIEEGMDHPLDFSDDIYRSFVSHFFTRQINQQTIDSHKLRLYQFFIGHKQSLIMKYRAYTQTALQSKDISDHTQDGGTTVTTLTRGANSTMPEDQVDVDVASTDMPYADDFTKSKQDVTTSNDGTDTTVNSTSQDKDLEFALNLPGELESLYAAAEAHQLFMQSY